MERKFREARLYQVAPISTNLILCYIAEQVLGLPKSYGEAREGMTTLDILLSLAAQVDLPKDARATARLSLFDWMVCGLAGVDEPVAQKVRTTLAAEGGHPVAAVMGAARLPARAARDGERHHTSHALDY